MSQAKRENTHFLLNVEKSKAKEAILERKRKAGLDIKPDPEVLKSFLHNATAVLILENPIKYHTFQKSLESSINLLYLSLFKYYPS